MKTTSKKKKKKGSKKTKRSVSNPKVIAKPNEAISEPTKELTKKVQVAIPKKVAEKKREEKGPKKSLLNVILQFLREAKLELKKVKWPTRKELLASTAMVLFLVLLVAAYLGVIDLALIKILKLIVG